MQNYYFRNQNLWPCGLCHKKTCTWDYETTDPPPRTSVQSENPCTWWGEFNWGGNEGKKIQVVEIKTIPFPNLLQAQQEPTSWHSHSVLASILTYTSLFFSSRTSMQAANRSQQDSASWKNILVTNIAYSFFYYLIFVKLLNILNITDNHRWDGKFVRLDHFWWR